MTDVLNNLSQVKNIIIPDEETDFDISDENGNVIVRFKDGNIYTQKFDSSSTATNISNGLMSASDKEKLDSVNNSVNSETIITPFQIADEEGNVVMQITKNGDILTQKFDSSKYEKKYRGKVISILGDSISTYGVPSATNEEGTYCYSYYPSATCRYSQDGNDSIQFDVNDTWWMRVINELDCTLGINESWRGSCVSSIRGDSGAVMSKLVRINHLGENGTPDMIIVYGGTNDAGQGAELGTFNTENPINYTTDEIAALPYTTFADAYRTMLIRLLKTYPNAEIVVILPTFTTSYYTITNLDLYVEIVKEVCDFFGIKYIDIRQSGITIYNKANYLVDGIHPNANGMKLIADKIIKNLIFN